MSHVLVVGSINMDQIFRLDHLPRPGETMLAGDVITVPGGKGANQAVAAARWAGRCAWSPGSASILLGAACARAWWRPGWM